MLKLPVIPLLYDFIEDITCLLTPYSQDPKLNARAQALIQEVFEFKNTLSNYTQQIESYLIEPRELAIKEKYIKPRCDHILGAVKAFREQLKELTIYDIAAQDLKLVLDRIEHHYQSYLQRLQPAHRVDTVVNRNDLKQEQANLNDLEAFNNTLAGIKQHYKQAGYSQRDCFISYAWPLQEKLSDSANPEVLAQQDESWIQPFLKLLRQHLREAGILAYLDIMDNAYGSNIYHFMEQAGISQYALVIGTESLLKKHQKGLAAVCNELVQIERKRREDRRLELTSHVFPLLLSGSVETSFPAYFERYSTIRWQNKDYVTNLKELIGAFYGVGADNKDYQDLWKPLEEALSEKAKNILPPEGSLPLAQAYSSSGLQNLDGSLSCLRQRVLQQKEIENELELYIPLSGAFSAGHDAELVDMEATVNDFLVSNKKVMLLLGEAGAGKTTFGRYLERKLWEAYEPSSSQAIPLFIPLTSLQEPVHHLLKETLKRYELSKKERLELKTQRSLILILDGYDELNKPDNLYGSNQLHEWNVKVIITCRSPYLMGVYSHRFAPIDALGRIDYSLYQEFHFKPFTSFQMEKYLQKYVEIRKPEWSDWRHYQKAIEEIPSLKELIGTPYIFHIVVEVLPIKVRKVDEDILLLDHVHLTRVNIYEAFIDKWFQDQEKKLRALGRLTDSDTEIQKDFLEYSKALACEMRNAGVNAVIWKPRGKRFFGKRENKDLRADSDSRWDIFFDDTDNPQLSLVRSGCPLRKQGDHQWLFIHISLQEYLRARNIIDQETDFDINIDINQILLTNESSVIRFLVDQCRMSQRFQVYLWQLLERSKTQKELTIAAANAITVLNYAGISFSGCNLKGINIQGADLTEAIFDHANLSEANLNKVQLRNAFLGTANLSYAQMENANFGVWPSLWHEKVAKCICYSPDDRWLAKAMGNDIYLWDLEADCLKSIFLGHQGTVNSINFRFDKQQLELASGSDDKTVILWDVPSGHQNYCFKHTSAVMSVCYRRDGKQLASGSKDNLVRLWNLSTMGLDFSLEGHISCVTSINYRPDSKQLASGSIDRTIKLWETETGRLEKSKEGYMASVWSLEYRCDGLQLASGSADNKVRLWNFDTDEEKILVGHGGPVTSICYRNDGKQLASGGCDRRIMLWDTLTGNLENNLEGNLSYVRSVCYKNDGQQLASSSNDESVRLWDVAINPLKFDLRGHLGAVRSLCHNADGQLLVSGSDDNTIKIWEAATGQLKRNLEGHTASIVSVCYRDDNQQLASASEDGTVKLWKTPFGYLEETLNISNVWDVNYIKGSKLLSIAGDNKLILYDSEACKLVKELEIPRSTSIGLSNDGKQFVLGGFDELFLYEIPKNCLQQEIIYHDKWKHFCVEINCICYRYDDHQLASGSKDGVVKLWEVETGKLINSFKHETSVLTINYLDNGKRLAYGAENGQIFIWDVECGIKLQEVFGHNKAITKLSFYSEGKFASGGEDFTIKLWREKTIDGEKKFVLEWNRGPHLFFTKGCQIRNVKGLNPREKSVLAEYGAIIAEEKSEEAVTLKKKTGCALQ